MKILGEDLPHRVLLGNPLSQGDGVQGLRTVWTILMIEIATNQSRRPCTRAKEGRVMSKISMLSSTKMLRK